MRADSRLPRVLSGYVDVFDSGNKSTPRARHGAFMNRV
jgi:hypothetical protein